MPECVINNRMKWQTVKTNNRLLLRSSLILVCTVCSELSVPIFRVFTVIISLDTRKGILQRALKRKHSDQIIMIRLLLLLMHAVNTFEIMVNGWMDDLQFYVLFNSISVISGQWADDNERLCALEPCLQWRRFCHEWGSNLGPLDQ